MQQLLVEFWHLYCYLRTYMAWVQPKHPTAKWLRASTAQGLTFVVAAVLLMNTGRWATSISYQGCLCSALQLYPLPQQLQASLALLLNTWTRPYGQPQAQPQTLPPTRLLEPQPLRQLPLLVLHQLPGRCRLQQTTSACWRQRACCWRHLTAAARTKKHRYVPADAAFR